MAAGGGRRKTREEISKKRMPKLGYYLIVTDTKETEKNYINGLRDSIPENLRRNLVIKVCKTKTSNLVSEAINMASLHPQYAEPWIIFDRDRVKGFDRIIKEAEDKGVRVAWSNPCIEIWFSAHFGPIPSCQDSVQCCSGFAKLFRDKVGQEYTKSNEDIYTKLINYGNENEAISNAENKYEEHIRSGRHKPAQMCPCTTVHKLVKEIKNKTQKARQQ